MKKVDEFIAVLNQIGAPDGVTPATSLHELSEEQREEFERGNFGTPPCFESKEQFDEWVDAGKNAPGDIFTEVSTYCEDCTPEYQGRMLDEGRCAYPCTVFTSKGGVRVFLVPATKYIAKRIAEARGK